MMAWWIALGVASSPAAAPLRFYTPIAVLPGNNLSEHGDHFYTIPASELVDNQARNSNESVWSLNA